ncbi:MAG: hypothetical protein JWM09_831 [Francisellaceae bacterium]|nr:hypothetical protein [Francisellaceae bacterium]
MTAPSCAYKDCSRSHHSNSNFCFWHDQDLDKSQLNIKSDLEELAYKGESMEGFCLKGVNLENLNLNPQAKESFINLRGAILSRANLKNAHLYSVDLSGANLLKADLSYANLNNANLSDANLLGIRLKNTKISHINWGEYLYQERMALEMEKKGHYQLAKLFFIEAEDIYRYLIVECQNYRGLSDEAGLFFYKKKVMKRHLLPRNSFIRFFSWTADFYYGYGERPLQAVNASFVIVVLFSILYFIFGLSQMNQHYIGYDFQQDFFDNFKNYLMCLNFSWENYTQVTARSLIPFSWISNLIAVIQNIIGRIALPLFMVLLVRRLTR